MKITTLLFSAFLLNAAHSYAQLKVTKISDKNNDHYIATVIGYPVAGLYVYKNQTEPVTQLNEDGTGIMQNEDLKKEAIIWGIECSESGIPLFKEGFDSAKYTFWYKMDSNKADENEWISTQFSIHHNNNKMFIAGQRVKEYIE
jgi:hypothetical protein